MSCYPAEYASNTYPLDNTGASGWTAKTTFVLQSSGLFVASITIGIGIPGFDVSQEVEFFIAVSGTPYARLSTHDSIGGFAQSPIISGLSRGVEYEATITAEMDGGFVKYTLDIAGAGSVDVTSASTSMLFNEVSMIFSDATPDTKFLRLEITDDGGAPPESPSDFWTGFVNTYEVP